MRDSVETLRLFDSGPLSLLPSPLCEPRRAWLAILIGAGLTIFGSLVLSWLASIIAPALAKPDFPAHGPWALFLLVVFAPFIETLIMAAVLSVLARLLPPSAAVLASALLWGIAHSLQAAAWGPVIWWPFLIFSTLYMVWRQRSVPAALAIVTATHALQNLLPALKIAFG